MLDFDHRRRLEGAVRALTIDSPNVCTWFGRRQDFGRDDSSDRRALIERFRLRVQSQLYRNFYCRGAAFAESESLPSDAPHSWEWMNRLSRSNRGTGCMDTGWRIIQRREASAVVTKNGLTIEVPGRDLIGATFVRLPKERFGYSPGFYAALSNRAFASNVPSFRVYWNLRPSGAEPFVMHATQLLNRMGIAYRLKVIGDPMRFTRCDAAVLYLLKRDAAKAFAAIDSLRRRLSRHLKPSTPVFAKPIAPGVAVAEQPPGGESFGAHRCGIVAKALVDSYFEGEHDVDVRLSRIIKTFAKAGISLDRPHLNPRSRDIYPCLIHI